jgi:hypothetical protein
VIITAGKTSTIGVTVSVGEADGFAGGAEVISGVVGEEKEGVWIREGL